MHFCYVNVLLKGVIGKHERKVDDIQRVIKSRYDDVHITIVLSKIRSFCNLR